MSFINRIIEALSGAKYRDQMPDPFADIRPVEFLAQVAMASKGIPAEMRSRALPYVISRGLSGAADAVEPTEASLRELSTGVQLARQMTLPRLLLENQLEGKRHSWPLPISNSGSIREFGPPVSALDRLPLPAEQQRLLRAHRRAQQKDRLASQIVRNKKIDRAYLPEVRELEALKQMVDAGNPFHHPEDLNAVGRMLFGD
jgi:hypothetical protein